MYQGCPRLVLRTERRRVGRRSEDEVSNPEPTTAPPPTVTDSDLSRLRLALTGPELLPRLRRDWARALRPGRRLADVRIARVFPREGLRVLIEYRMTFDTDRGPDVETVFGEFSPEDPHRRCATLVEGLRKNHRKQLTRKTETDRIAAFPEAGLVLRCRGLDDRIDGLRMFYKRRYAEEVLSRHVAGGAAVRLSGHEFLGHRPGRRVVVRLAYEEAGAGPATVIAKLYPARSDRAGDACDVLHALRRSEFGAGSPVRVPRPVAHVPEMSLLFMEDAGSAADAPNGGDGADELSAAAAGRALARLHASSYVPRSRHTPEDEIAILEDRIEVAARLAPESEGPLRDTFARVRGALAAAAPSRLCAVHRDFHTGQVVTGPAGTILLDFDTVCASDPALDVGNYLGQLYDPLEGASRPEAAAQAFLEAYGARSEAMFRRIEAYRGSSLLRLAAMTALTSSRDRVAAILGAAR